MQLTLASMACRVPDEAPQAVQDLITSCLQSEARNRPDMRNVIASLVTLSTGHLTSPPNFFNVALG